MQRLPELAFEDADGSSTDGDDDVLNSDAEDENFLPSAPLLSEFDLPPGYEAATFNDEASIAPPAYDTLFPTPFVSPPTQTNIAQIMEEEAKTLLLDHVAYKSCYGISAAREMTITRINNSSAYYYVLKTLGEQRSLCRKFKPFRNEVIPSYSFIPSPWDIPASPPHGFTKEKQKIDIAETQVVKTCHKCNGKGIVYCSACKGRGKKTCTFCGGRGKRANGHRCSSCGGRGRKTCLRCHGRRKITCKVCDGCKKLIHYIQLVIEWKPYKGGHVVKRSSLPDKYIKSVKGETVFTDDQIRVQPITGFHEPEINSCSASIIATHIADIAPKEMIIHQHQSVSIIPITEVSYEWKDKRRKFYVYGSEKRVHAPHYPQNCCYCCTIL